MRIDPTMVPQAAVPQAGSNSPAKVSGQGTFAEALNSTLEQLEAMEEQAHADSLALAAGTLDNPQEALVNAEKAELALQLVLEVRNKCLDAYNEIMRMQF